MSFLRLVQAVFGVWVLIIMLGAIPFALGAITGKKGLAGSAGGMFAFVSYLITSFAPSVPSLETVEKLSPFHYYNNPSIAEHGLAGNNLLVMLGVWVVLILVSGVVFAKRDIYQK